MVSPTNDWGHLIFLQDLKTLTIDIEEVASPNSMHMLWLLPQYFVLTAGEVLFSITSLSFSFTQAPESMKAVVQVSRTNDIALPNNLVSVKYEGSLCFFFLT